MPHVIFVMHSSSFGSVKDAKLFDRSLYVCGGGNICPTANLIKPNQDARRTLSVSSTDQNSASWGAAAVAFKPLAGPLSRVHPGANIATDRPTTATSPTAPAQAGPGPLPGRLGGPRPKQSIPAYTSHRRSSPARALERRRWSMLHQ
mmetsp:Transcript_50462/g.68614  ORF Transcript_50462/g.68614 Transcript_50462/m.68614 type:complete len:147 (+) Transcript_50462:380-820(+)